MKKILVLFLSVILLVAAGCTNSNNSQTSNKKFIETDVLNVDEYTKRLVELFNNTALIIDIIDFPFEYPKEVDKYFEKYKDYEPEKQYNLACIDAYEDFIDGLIKFKPYDDTLNKIHNDIINNAMLIHSSLEDASEAYEKYEKYSKETKENEYDANISSEYFNEYLNIRDYTESYMINILDDFVNYLEEINYSYSKSL